MAPTRSAAVSGRLFSTPAGQPEWAQPRRLPDSVQFGGETEAIHCAVYLAEAWQRHPQALSWLKGGSG